MATQDEVRAALAASIPGYTPTDADVAYWTNQGGVDAVSKTFGSAPAPAPAPATVGWGAAQGGPSASAIATTTVGGKGGPAQGGNRIQISDLTPQERALFERQYNATDGWGRKNADAWRIQGIDPFKDGITEQGRQNLRTTLDSLYNGNIIRTEYNNSLGTGAKPEDFMGMRWSPEVGWGDYSTKSNAAGYFGGATTGAVGGSGYNGGGVGGASPGATPGAGGASTGSASSGNGLVQGVNVNQYQQNPYLSQMGDVLTNRVTDNLQRQIMPSIRSNAVAAGGFGGSRQGVVEANAMKDAKQTISDALTGAYFQDFTNQMNRNLAQYGQNQNFFSNQRGQDLQQLALGANLFQQGNQGWLSQGQGLLGLGQTQQQAPWQVINNANAGLGQWSGYGTTTSANQGGGAQGVLGGAMAGGQLGSLWGGAGLNSGSQLGQMTNRQIEQSWGLPG